MDEKEKRILSLQKIFVSAKNDAEQAHAIETGNSCDGIITRKNEKRRDLREVRILETMKATGLPRDRAEFIYALESGEIDSDEHILED